MTKKPYTIKDAINNPTGCLFILLKGIGICFILLVIIGLILPEPEPQSSPNVINKSNFNGNWAFTVDSVSLHHINIDGLSDGVEVIIDNKTYALTRNIKDREFLPNNLWLDAEMETVGSYRICNEVMLDKNTCKKSLSDLIKYAETLPTEKY